MKVLHYGDAFLDENIEIHHFDFATMNLDDLNVLQATIERRKQQEIIQTEECNAKHQRHLFGCIHYHLT